MIMKDVLTTTWIKMLIQRRKEIYKCPELYLCMLDNATIEITFATLQEH